MSQKKVTGKINTSQVAGPSRAPDVYQNDPQQVQPGINILPPTPQSILDPNNTTNFDITPQDLDGNVFEYTYGPAVKDLTSSFEEPQQPKRPPTQRQGQGQRPRPRPRSRLRPRPREPPPNVGGYIPDPYIFVIDGEEVMPNTASAARMPPYWLLVDHLFAIIFCMCSEKFAKKPSLGVSQLAWALELLKSIKPRRTSLYEDPKKLQTAIEDRLLECYAEIGNKQREAEEIALSDQAAGSQTPPRSEYGENRTQIMKKPMARTSSPKHGSMIGLHSPEGSHVEYNKFASGLVVPYRGEGSTLDPSGPSLSPPSNLNRPQDYLQAPQVLPGGQQGQYGQQGQQRSLSPIHERSRQMPEDSSENQVLSVTYNEVVARAPPMPQTPAKFKMSQRRLFDDDYKEATPAPEENVPLSEINPPEVPSKVPEGTISRQNLLDFFNNWREEQVARLEIEVQRLSHIEEFMGRIDENFDRVLDGNDARRVGAQGAANIARPDKQQVPKKNTTM